MLPAVTVTTAHAANSKDITQVGSVDVTSVTDTSGKEFNGVRTDGTKITNGIDMAANGQKVVVNLRGTINDAGALSKGDTVTIPYSTVDGSHYPIPGLQGPSPH